MVDVDELKSLRDLGLDRIVANWLFDALVNLAGVVHGQQVGEIGSRLGNVTRGLDGVLVRMYQTLVPDVRPAPPPCQWSALPV